MPTCGVSHASVSQGKIGVARFGDKGEEPVEFLICGPHKQAGHALLLYFAADAPESVRPAVRKIL